MVSQGLVVLGVCIGYLIIGAILAYIGHKIIGKDSSGTLERLLFLGWPGVLPLGILLGLCFLCIASPEIFEALDRKLKYNKLINDRNNNIHSRKL